MHVGEWGVPAGERREEVGEGWGVEGTLCGPRMVRGGGNAWKSDSDG